MNIFNINLAVLLATAMAITSTCAIGQTAADGNNNATATCVACHGAKGEGNAQMNAPRIAGQSQTYLARQLTAYANGSRNNQVMAPIAKQLTEQQIAAISSYYAGLAAPSLKTSSTAATNLLKRGQTLATIGDEKLGVQACGNCHGPDGAGEPPTYPYLAGQHGAYLNAALGEWKSGARHTDLSQQMNMIAKRLNDNDIAALSAYYAAQPAPIPASQRSNVPTGSVARPTTPGSTTQGGSTPVTGTGTEQGAATSGGSQGPGGGGGASGSGPSGNPKSDR
jgi:cytochrome c553